MKTGEGVAAGEGLRRGIQSQKGGHTWGLPRSYGRFSLCDPCAGMGPFQGFGPRVVLVTLCLSNSFPSQLSKIHFLHNWDQPRGCGLGLKQERAWHMVSASGLARGEEAGSSSP